MRSLAVLLAALLGLGLVASCTGEDDQDRDDEGGTMSAEAEQGLRDARAGVIAEVRPVITALAEELPGTLRFNTGNYNSCGNDLDGPTAYSWSVRGRIDTGVPGAEAIDGATGHLTEQGFEIVEDETIPERVVATRGSVRLMVETLPGEDALLFTGSDDTCFELGRERAREYAGGDPDPLG